MIAGKARAPEDGLAVDAGADQLGEPHQLREGAGPRDPVARDDERRFRRAENFRRALKSRGLRPRERREHRGRVARVLHGLAHQIHRQREEDRAGGRRQRELERAAQGRRRFVRAADFVRPLGELFSQLHEIAREDRVVHEKARVLLAGGDEQRSLGARGVVQDREPVGHARRHVDVDDPDLPRGLGVTVRRRHRGRLLERHHVLEPGVGQRVEERQLGGAGVAEEMAHAAPPQDLHQDRGDAHAAVGLRTQQRGRHGRSRRHAGLFNS